MATHKLFRTPGVFYRPTELKSMTVLRGDSDQSRQVYQHFQLHNLHNNTSDYTHYAYQKYLQLQQFIPPAEGGYFEHLMRHTVATAPDTTAAKGLCNLFPLDLSPRFNYPHSTNLGVVSTSPLKLELEMSPVPTNTWFLVYVFVYLNKITFPGQKTKQDVIVEQI